MTFLQSSYHTILTQHQLLLTLPLSHYVPRRYPCSQPGCGQTVSTCGGWNTPFNDSIAWLTAYRNESELVSPPDKKLQVVITETGWCMDCCTEADRALWTVAAYEKLWLPDDLVIGVTPFLLTGKQWEQKGFVWMLSNGTKLPVYNAVRALRCKQAGFACIWMSRSGYLHSYFDNQIILKWQIWQIDKW